MLPEVYYAEGMYAMYAFATLEIGLKLSIGNVYNAGHLDTFVTLCSLRFFLMKLTIGALDPNDHEGTINWVQLNQTPDAEGDYFNTFNFDGVKGYDGQFVPCTGTLSAALDSSGNTFLSVCSDRSEAEFFLFQYPCPFRFPTPTFISAAPTRRDLSHSPLDLSLMRDCSNTTVHLTLLHPLVYLNRRTSH